MPVVLRVLAEHLVHLVVLIGGDEEVRVAVLAGEGRGAGIRADQEGAAVGDRLDDRDQDVGEDRADDEVDLVALDQRLDLAHRDVGLELVVLHDDLDVAAAELAAEVLDAELEAVAQLPPSTAGGPDSVVITPILSLSCACACAETRRTAPAAAATAIALKLLISPPRCWTLALPILSVT